MNRSLKLLPIGPVFYNVQDSEHPSGHSRLDADEFLATYGSARNLEQAGARADLLDRIERQHVHGRGGAHFPSAIKIQSAITAGGGGYVIANAAEGEPSAAKDAALWQVNPHLVIRGLTAVAKLTNAERAGIWVHEDSLATRSSIDRALRERETRSSGGEIPIDVFPAPHRYVSGEASAIINAVQGGPAVPKFVPSKSRAWGAGNVPVLVFNSETLAHIALLTGEGYDAEHTERSLITVLEPGRRTVREVSERTTFSELLGDQNVPHAVLLGGYGGHWSLWQEVAELHVSEKSLRSLGLSLGAGIVAPLPGDICGVTETARITEWMAHESAQQCGPCVFGLQWLAEDTQNLASGGRTVGSALSRMRERLPLLHRRGACAHPDGVARMVSTALNVFEHEISLHARKQCSATYHAPFFPTTQGIHA